MLLNGKDSGQLHVHPFEKVNVSAIISRADSGIAKVVLKDSEVISPIRMASKGNRFWCEIEMTEELEDYQEYRVVVRAENPNGSEEEVCGRVLRINHLFVNSVVSPGVVVDSFNLTLTARTWDNLSVGRGKASVTMVRYHSAENFSSSYLGEKALNEFSSVRFTRNLSIENISILKFDADVLDEERGYLGRTTTYAIGVPFFIDVSCERIIETIQGHLVCGPFDPKEGMNIHVSTLPEVNNLSLEVYESSQFQELLFGSEEPLYTQDIVLTNGSGQETVAVPGTNGSFMLLARGMIDGNESMGFFMFQVQDFSIYAYCPLESNRSEEITIQIIPERGIKDAKMTVSIGTPDGIVLLLDSPALWGGDAYYLNFTVPLYAVNGTYYVVGYYRGGNLFEIYSIGFTRFNVTGGPTTPPPPEQPPPPRSEGNAFFITRMIIFILIFVGILLFSVRWASKRGYLLDADKVHRGAPEDLEKEAKDREEADPQGESKEPKDKGKGRIEIELGKREREHG